MMDKLREILLQLKGIENNYGELALKEIANGILDLIEKEIVPEIYTGVEESEANKETKEYMRGYNRAISETKANIRKMRENG